MATRYFHKSTNTAMRTLEPRPVALEDIIDFWVESRYVVEGEITSYDYEYDPDQQAFEFDLHVDEVEKIGSETGTDRDDRQPWEVYQDDIHALLDVLNLGTHARSGSPHEVLHQEIIPEIRKYRHKLREIEDLTDTGGGPDDPVLTPEGANILIRIGQIAHRTLENEG